MNDSTEQKPKQTKVWVIGAIAVIAAFFGGFGLGLGASEDQTSDATAETVAAEPTPMHPPEPEPEPEPVEDDPEPITDPEPVETGPETFVIGDTGTVTEDGVETGTVTVESFETTTAAQDEYSDPPSNGQFLILTVEATALEGQLFDINPFDFYVRDAEGNRWDGMSGSSYFLDSDLNAVTLNGGETVRGTLALDVPPEATEVVYAPGMRALGVWTLS